jgi:hypothetical protein
MHIVYPDGIHIDQQIGKYDVVLRFFIKFQLAGIHNGESTENDRPEFGSGSGDVRRAAEILKMMNFLYLFHRIEITGCGIVVKLLKTKDIRILFFNPVDHFSNRNGIPSILVVKIKNLGIISKQFNLPFRVRIMKANGIPDKSKADQKYEQWKNHVDLQVFQSPYEQKEVE